MPLAKFPPPLRGSEYSNGAYAARRRRLRPLRTLQALLCVVAVAVLRLCVRSPGFVSGHAGRVAPHAARRSVAIALGSKVPRAGLLIGQKCRGTVVQVQEWGAFVDIGADREGLLHISRVAEGRIDSIHDYVEAGKEVEVWISELRDDGKFGLTMVRSKISRRGGARSVPDVSSFAGVSPSEWLVGTVAAFAPFGAFVTLSSPDGEGTAEGLLHISRVQESFVESLEDELQVGQEIRVRVESVDVERGRLRLSMKEPYTGGGGALREPADYSAFQGISSHQWLTGTVARTASFGAFVTVTAEDGTEADGLVHIRKIRDAFVQSVEDELEPGQEVQVRIVSLDVAAGRMGLSMRSPEADIGE